MANSACVGVAGVKPKPPSAVASRGLNSGHSDEARLGIGCVGRFGHSVKLRRGYAHEARSGRSARGRSGNWACARGRDWIAERRSFRWLIRYR